jgi:phosphotransferase system  glucose/maltose/N-acetylglucosamine-specific IIC component
MLKKILFFYIDGFKNMSSIGQKLWLIIIIKLVVIFVVLKVFFFPTIDQKVKNEGEKEALYLNQLTKSAAIKQKKEE